MSDTKISTEIDDDTDDGPGYGSAEGETSGAFINEDGMIVGTLGVAGEVTLSVQSPTLPAGKYKLKIDLPSLIKGTSGVGAKSNKTWFRVSPRFTLIDEKGLQLLKAQGWEPEGDKREYFIYYSGQMFLDFIDEKPGNPLDFSQEKNTNLKQFMKMCKITEDVLRAKGYPGMFEGITVIGDVTKEPMKADEELGRVDNSAVRWRNSVKVFKRV